MAKAVVKRKTCVNCGADVRPETQFCYNCGKSVDELDSIPETDPRENGDNKTEATDAKGSLVDLENALAASRLTANDAKIKLDSAAAKRRQARSGQRKPVEITWEPPTAGTNRLYTLAVTLIFVLVVAVVFLTVFYK